MLTCSGNKDSKCSDTRIPMFVPIDDLVRVSDVTDTNNTKIEHSIGDFTLTWSDKHPELVRLHSKSSAGNDAWVMRSQLAYVLERHRGAVRSILKSNKASGRDFYSVDAWDMSRLSMGKEICATLRTRGFYVPDDAGSADVIGAVGIALTGIRDPLLEFRHRQLLTATPAEGEVFGGHDTGDSDVRVTARTVLSNHRAIADKCESQVNMFGRISASNGNELLSSFRQLISLVAVVLDASRVTTTEHRMKALRLRGDIPVAKTSPVPATVIPPPLVFVEDVTPLVDNDEASSVADPCLPRAKTATPDGWLARPTATNAEACALYDRIVEALLAGKSISVSDADNVNTVGDIRISTDTEAISESRDSSVVLVDTDEINRLEAENE